MIFCALLLSLLSTTGCMTRRLTINSNPPGARVYVSDEEIGITPVSHDFTYYGTRKIRLVKDGYETLIVNQPIPAPWYEIPPLDFVSENLVPGEIIDHRKITYEMRPRQVEPREQIIQKAESLRRSSLSQSPTTAPLGTAVPPNMTQIPANGGSLSPLGNPLAAPPPGTTLPPPANSQQWIYPNQ